MVKTIDGLPILDDGIVCNPGSIKKVLGKTGCEGAEGYAAWIDISDLALDQSDIIQMVINYFSQAGVQSPTALEVCAYLQSLTGSATVTPATKVVLGDCTTGTVGSILANTTNVFTTSGNTATSTVNGVTATAPIVNSIATSTDVNGDLIVTVNGIASTPIDINPDCADVVACVEAAPVLNLNDVNTDNISTTGNLVIPASQLSHTSAGNTSSITVGNQTATAPIVNSNALSSTGLTLTSTVNGVADSENLQPAVLAEIVANTDSLVSQPTGHTIATHTAVDNTVININETVTSLGTPTLAGNILTIAFNNENGVAQTVTVDLGGILPTLNKCGGGTLTPADGVLTSDSLTTNTTAPTTVAPTPDITQGEWYPTQKVRSGCGEVEYVQTPRYAIRQSLTPTAIVTANPLVADANDGGYDSYRSIASYSNTTPVGNYLYDFDARATNSIYSPNSDGNLWVIAFGTGNYYMNVHTSEYSMQQPTIYGDIVWVNKGKDTVNNTALSFNLQSRVIVPMGIAPIMSGGWFAFNLRDAIITFIPTN